MTNYLSEALILARTGVVSMITDAPAHDGQTDRTDPRQFQTDTVISLRMALDLLLRQKGVDSGRIAFVGHSYGAAAGGALAAVEPRFRTFVLLGGVAAQPSQPTNPAAPENFLPQAKAPILVQCARFDTPDNLAGCPQVHTLAGGPKRLVWYHDDHAFTSWEAAVDRMNWLASHLKFRDVPKAIRDHLRR